MADVHKHHEELMSGVSKEFEDIFKESGQGIYIYLDDEHKVCNYKFSEMLGYQSTGDWAKVKESFPQVFVAEKDQETLVDAYSKAMEQKVGSVISVTWKKKDGNEITTEVILVPINFQGHSFALHFVSEK